MSLLHSLGWLWGVGPSLPQEFFGEPFPLYSSVVGPNRTADLVRDRFLRRHRPFFLRIRPAATPPPDPRHSVLEDSQRIDGDGRSQWPGRRALHDDRAHHRAALLLLPHAGLGVQTKRQK